MSDRRPIQSILKLPRIIIRGLIRLYQLTLSPLIHAILGPGAGCRFTPSCSEYARIAYSEHGFFRATWLSAWRILRCNPFGRGGFDPVPAGKSSPCDHQSER
jgi:putative membrane protein insertion efficiency factor